MLVLRRSRIGYINTHGTGTPANDPAELYGLRQIFGQDLFSRIPLSSSKAYFGHNLGAAASIEYVTTLLAMQEGLLPATLHFEEAREGCEDINLIANEMLDSILNISFVTTQRLEDIIVLLFLEIGNLKEILKTFYS